MISKYVAGFLFSAFLGFWGAQAIIYFYASQLELGTQRRKTTTQLPVRCPGVIMDRINCRDHLAAAKVHPRVRGWPTGTGPV